MQPHEAILSEGGSDAATLEKEREFHNRRFGGPQRPQDGFYAAIPRCAERFHHLVEEGVEGADALEYGCGQTAVALRHGQGARSLLGIDISDVAIAQANAEAEARGLRQMRFRVMNAEKLDVPDASFDFVFGAGILHHLSLDAAYAELRRVMRPHAQGVFLEPLGHNPIINWYRRRTPEARTEDEHPMRMADFERARRFFGDVRIETHGLAALAAIPVRDTPLFGPVRGIGGLLDRVLLSLPGLRQQGWMAIMRLRA